MNDTRRVLLGAALGLGDLMALLALRPDAGLLAEEVAAPHAWVEHAGADGAAMTLAGAGLWCAALWLGTGLLAALATQLPGFLGRTARTLARALLPAAVYRVVAGAAGLGVLLAPIAAGAAVPHPSRGIVVPGGGSPSIPAPTWPTDPPPRPPSVPTPAWPMDPPRHKAAVPAPGRPVSPASTPPAPSSSVPPVPASVSPASPARSVVVRPGDSLWRIAAAELGPAATPGRLARAWPQWYAANRAVIGADPDVIRPGQHLRPPTPMRSAP